jgi:hypothetical protein
LRLKKKRLFFLLSLHRTDITLIHTYDYFKQIFSNSIAHSFLKDDDTRSSKLHSMRTNLHSYEQSKKEEDPLQYLTKWWPRR